MKAFVTGLLGQDGATLSKQLIEKGIDVYGLVRRTSTRSTWRIDNIKDRIKIVEGDLLDQGSLFRLLKEIKPDYVVNLGAQSFVGLSWQQPVLTFDVTANGAINLLEAVRSECPEARHYQASSITGDTPVLVKIDGQIKRTHLKDTLNTNNLEIFSYNKNHKKCMFMPVKSIINHGFKKVYRIITKGKGEVKVTEDHSLFVWSSDGISCKLTKDIKVGDFLVGFCGDLNENNKYPIVNLNLEFSHHIPNRYHKSLRIDKKIVKRDIEITPELSRLCGYYLAEGCSEIRKRKDRMSLTFGKHNFDYPRIPDSISLLEKYFNKKPCVIDRSSSVVIRVNGKEVSTFFSKMGCTSHYKRVPDFVWSAPKECVIEFLWGYAGDARVCSGGNLIYTTVNKELQTDIVYLCRMNGIPARKFRRITKDHPSPTGNNIKGGIVYDVHVPRGYLYGEFPEGSKTPESMCVPSISVSKEDFIGITPDKFYKKNIGKSYLKNLNSENELAKGALCSSEIVAVENGIEEEVFDYEVPECENFFCGQLPILAHNSSEMFGKSVGTNEKQNEDTPFKPRSPYGVAKLAAHHMTVNYRESYGLFAVSGILFNHEGELRGPEFVTRKITSQCARIKYGLQKSIKLGDLSTKRDFSYAPDMTEAMWLMLNNDKPEDFVVGSGETHTIQEFLDGVLKRMKLTKDVMEIDKSLLRPAEVKYLCADASRIKERLGWKPTVGFEQLIDIMVEADLKRAKRELEISKL